MPESIGSTVVYVLLALALAIATALTVARVERRRFLQTVKSVVAAASTGTGRQGASGGEPRPSREYHAVTQAFDRVAEELRDRMARVEQERQAVLSVLSCLSDGVLVTDANGIIVLANRSQQERLGLPEHRVLGRSLIEVMHDHEVHELVQRCLASDMEQKALVETEPGRRFVNVSATPLGRREGCAVVFQDKTELRRLEKVRRDFVANISHELRTPLTTLKLLSETLGPGRGDDVTVVSDYVSRIGIEVDRLSQLVDELGELSLIESGQVALERIPVSVGAVIARAFERLEAQASRAGLELEVSVADNLPAPRGDERRLEQVLVNLLHNAIKFTPEGGSIRVAAEEADGEVRVMVEDTGIGIPQEDLDRVFERFYKTDKSRASSGTGLGLAIARHIIGGHGGRIWVESVEGRGSKFSFTLPVVDAGT